MIYVQPQTREWRRKLERYSEQALPRVRAATVNALARAASVAQRRNLQREFTLRNTYTVRSLRFREARVSRRTGRAGYAQVGTISPYLPLQETGGTRRPKRGRLVPVPTTEARLGNWRKPIPRRLALGPRVRFGQTVRGGKKGRGRATTFFILGPGPHMRRPAVFLRQGKRLMKIRTLEQRFRLRPTHWHTDAVRRYATHSLAAQVFVREARKELWLIK